jgi:hypothetical protein
MRDLDSLCLCGAIACWVMALAMVALGAGGKIDKVLADAAAAMDAGVESADAGQLR